MDLKDYYTILNLDDSADEQEIKKAYRRQAMKFHPDKNEGNRLAENHFKEVLEAYRVLSDPRQRSAYNQQRWYRKNARNPSDDLPATPYRILHKCLTLNRYISTLDSFHLNRPALNHYILQLLSKRHQHVLVTTRDSSYINEIVKELLKSAELLRFKSFEKICVILVELAGTDTVLIEKINRHMRQKRIVAHWNTYRPLFVLLISVLLCLLIYLLSNNRS